VTTEDGNVWYFVKKLGVHVGEICVINTMKFKVIVESRSTTGRRDLQTIAEYLQRNMLTTMKLPDGTSRMIDKYVKIRDRYVKQSTRIKNQINVMSAKEGIYLKSIDLPFTIRLRSVNMEQVVRIFHFLSTDC